MYDYRFHITGACQGLTELEEKSLDGSKEHDAFLVDASTFASS
jgi:hypothetical protein